MYHMYCRTCDVKCPTGWRSKKLLTDFVHASNYIQKAWLENVYAEFKYKGEVALEMIDWHDFMSEHADHDVIVIHYKN